MLFVGEEFGNSLAHCSGFRVSYEVSVKILAGNNYIKILNILSHQGSVAQN